MRLTLALTALAVVTLSAPVLADKAEEEYISDLAQATIVGLRTGDAEAVAASLDELAATAQDEATSIPCRLYADHALATLATLDAVSRFPASQKLTTIATQLFDDRGVYQGFCVLAPIIHHVPPPPGLPEDTDD